MIHYDIDKAGMQSNKMIINLRTWCVCVSSELMRGLSRSDGLISFNSSTASLSKPIACIRISNRVSEVEQSVSTTS